MRSLQMLAESPPIPRLPQDHVAIASARPFPPDFHKAPHATQAPSRPGFSLRPASVSPQTNGSIPRSGIALRRWLQDLQHRSGSRQLRNPDRDRPTTTKIASETSNAAPQEGWQPMREQPLDS